MSLYPTLLIDATTAADGPNAVPSGTLALVPIDMTQRVMVQIDVAQASLTQDFSLRGWISTTADQESLVAYPGYFPLLRGNGLSIVLFLPLHTPPAACIAVPVVRPIVYYLNILNLTNEVNAFVFSMTVLA